jgi:DNA-binding XRE family transcriptional regulator
MNSTENTQQAHTSSSDDAASISVKEITVAGRVFMVGEVLKDLRAERLQSQEDMANACSDGKFRVSIATIKRAETGKPVVYRVARELARYFNVPVNKIVKPRLSNPLQ